MVSAFVAAGSLGALLLGGSAVYVAYLLSRRVGGREPGVERELARERLQAYREIMAAVIGLNRTAIELGGMQLQEEADLLLHDQESALSEQYGDVAVAYESKYHIISPEVRDATSEYVDYLATYHEEGVQPGELLSLSGGIAEAMRRDFDLDTLFRDDEDESVDSGVDNT
jgi:hypothetical protein